jgi:transposase
MYNPVARTLQHKHTIKGISMVIKNKRFIGIDVSKTTLDISMEGKHFKIKNEEASIHFFIEKEIILKENFPSLVCLESTGKLELLAMRCFAESKIPIHKAHPNRIHSFAKASGHFAKTDKLDAKLLEKYACFIFDKEKGDTAISQATLELQELRNVEKDLMAFLHATKCRIKRTFGSAKEHYELQVKFMNEQIKLIRKAIENVVKSDIDLKRKYDLLITYKGVAKQTSHALLAELPELGQLNKKEIASLVGVAPKLYESGIKKFKGHIFGGRFFIRKALYMAALVASQYNDTMKIFYDRLIVNGKAKMQALTAVMRKIIVCLNAMIKNNKKYKIA